MLKKLFTLHIESACWPFIPLVNLRYFSFCIEHAFSNCLSFSQLFGHENVSVLDGGLERWIGDGYETTNMMVKKKV